MPHIHTQSKNIFFIAFFLAGFFAAHHVHAQIVIDEIMYDANGSDSGREWIEVRNVGKESINFSKWKFSEGNSNHGLTAVKGSSVLIPGDYAIIADDPEKFKNDRPDFPGVIFDSAFSLSNAGETLALKDSSLNLSDEVSYLSSWGANGDGKSLQRADMKWGTGTPTPGLENVVESDANSATDQTANQASDGSVNQNKISATIISESRSIVGEKLSFEGTASDSSGAILTTGKYIWNFGDGNTEEGRAGNSVDHAYLYSGDYVAVLDYFQDEKSASPIASARVVVNVSDPQPISGKDSHLISDKSAGVITASDTQANPNKNLRSGGNDSGSHDQSAALMDGFRKSDTTIYMWLAALLGLIIVSTGSALFLRKSKTAAHRESDEIEIID